MKFELYSGGKKVDVDVAPEGEGLKVAFGGKQFVIQLTRAQTGDAILAHLDDDDLSVVLEEETESVLRFSINGESITLGRAQTQVQAGASSSESPSTSATEKEALSSPLYGKVVSVDVKTGDVVDSGQSLLVLEAMKMESVLRADAKHKIKEVLVKEGDGVNKGQVLMRFSAAEAQE